MTASPKESVTIAQELIQKDKVVIGISGSYLALGELLEFFKRTKRLIYQLTPFIQA